MKWYFTIQDWMIRDFKLKGAELLVFAYLWSWIDSGRDCPERGEEVAAKLGISRRKYYVAIASIVQKLHLECRKCTKIVQKMHCTECRNCTIAVQKMHCTIHIPYIITECNDDVNAHAHAHAREEELLRNGVSGTVEQFAKELLSEIDSGGTVSESAMRLYGLKADELKEYVVYFADKLTMDGVETKTRGDFRRHFNSWLKIQVKEKFENNGKQQVTGNGSGKGRVHAALCWQRGVSDEYLQGLVRKAAGAVQSDSDK